MPDYDFIVVGGGLAGACAALHLAKHGSVLILEKEKPGAGGSSAAAGMINPILGLRARPVWRIGEALPALEELIAESGSENIYRRGPTVRPAYGRDQVERFRRSAGEFAEHAAWIPPAECTARYPDVVATEGALLIRTGGALDIPAFIERLLAAARRRGAILETGRQVTEWEDGGVTLGGGGHIHGVHIVLALGRGYARFPELERLRLHQVKGQTIRLSRPAGLPPDLPHLAGKGYVAHDDGELVAGSTYEHAFEHLAPAEHHTQAILRKTGRMLPALRGARVLEARAGVRVTVPGIRLPMVGPLPGRRRVWIFTGFGAKGLLTAPLAARELASYFEDPGRIPSETRVRLAH